MNAKRLLSVTLLGLFLIPPAQAAPLNLVLDDFPNIFSGLIDIDYHAGIDLFSANGAALELDDDGSVPAEMIGDFGHFDLYAVIDSDGTLIEGALTISGTVPSLGFNSGTLLTGTLTGFGYTDGFGGPLEFLFDVTGGDAAGLYGAGPAGIILAGGSGFSGDFTSFFSGFNWSSDMAPVPVPADTDGDGIADSTDNCTNVANPGQQDTDGDGHGNICDADFDNNCFTTFPDLSIMQAGFFTADPLLDLNGSGGPVNFADLAIMQGLFFLPPGPSAPGALCNPPAPAPPVLTGTDPASPSADLTPLVDGLAESGTLVNIYNDPSCVGSVLGAGVTTASGDFSIEVSVVANTATTFYATATDDSGNVSDCSSSWLLYVTDTSPPEPPLLTGTDPASPSADLTPLVDGLAESGTLVNIYNDPSCVGSVLGAGVTTASGDFSIEVSVVANTATTFYATATDDSGNVSDCSSSLVYISLGACSSPDSFEPNETEATSWFLGTVSDSDDGASLNAEFDPPSDVDWYRFFVADSSGGILDPSASVTPPSPLETCIYYECEIGTTWFTCPSGSFSAVSPLGRKGCCAAGSIQIEPDCGLGLDDSGDAFIQIRDGGMTNNCVSYHLDWAP